MSNRTNPFAASLVTLIEAMAETRRIACPDATADEIAESIKASLLKMVSAP
jgi:hypothetical protein